MKKAVITILGLAGGKIVKKDNNKLNAINFKSQHDYYFNKKEKDFLNIPILYLF